MTPPPALRCPRCAREAAHPAPYCARCGAPLLLEDETVRPLDVALDLERRTSRAPLSLTLSPRAAPQAPAEDGQLPDADVDALEVHVQRAASWRRAGAWAVDALPFAAGGAAFARSLLGDAGAALGPAGDPDLLLELLARERVIALSVGAAVALALAVYVTVAHALAGVTLGKWLLRLRVIGPDGGPPSPARSAARSALALLSGTALGLGFLVALFTRSGRGLHDFVARTWVVKAP